MPVLPTAAEVLGCVAAGAAALVYAVAAPAVAQAVAPVLADEAPAGADVTDARPWDEADFADASVWEHETLAGTRVPEGLPAGPAAELSASDSVFSTLGDEEFDDLGWGVSHEEPDAALGDSGAAGVDPVGGDGTAGFAPAADAPDQQAGSPAVPLAGAQPLSQAAVEAMAGLNRPAPPAASGAEAPSASTPAPAEGRSDGLPPGADAPGSPGREAGGAAVQGSAADAQAYLDRAGLRFEANVGQFGGGAAFVARGGGYDLFLSAGQAQFVLPGPAQAAADGQVPGAGEPTVVSMQLVGANPQAQASGLNQLVTKTNYLIGNDPSGWFTDVSNYGAVKFTGVYAGVDVVYYTAPGGGLEHDFLVAPGADPGQVVTRFAGATGLEVNAGGDLVIRTGAGELVQHRPYTYQDVGGVRQEVASRFVVRGDEVRVEVGAYDTTRALVIDPKWGYSSYLGNTGFETGRGIAYLVTEAYVVGTTSSVWTPPQPPGPVPRVFPNGAAGRGADVFVAKFNFNGGALEALTYLVGNNNDDGQAIALAENAVYVTGITYSNNFITTAGSWQATKWPGKGANAFLVKFNLALNNYDWATYVGGSLDAGTKAFAIAVNGTEDGVYIAGETGEFDLGMFNPARGTNLDPGFAGGGMDAFFAKFSSGGTLAYWAYAGGAAYDTARGIDVDQYDNVYLTGYSTKPTDPNATIFPTTAGAFQREHQGRDDAFLAKVQKPAGAAPPSFVFSTLFGGSGDDGAYGIAVDQTNPDNVYIAGLTDTPRLTKFGKAPQTIEATPKGPGGGYDAFVAKFVSGAPTKFVSVGGSRGDAALAIALTAGSDPKVYITGHTFSADFPTQNALQAKKAPGKGADAFVARIDMKPQLAPPEIEFSTFLGGTEDDRGFGIAVNGAVYVTGRTSSAVGFRPKNPMGTPPINGFQKVHGGSGDAFAVRIDPDAAVTALAPALAPLPDLQVAAGALLTFTATATTWDGGPPAFFLDGAPQGASIDEVTGVFTWTPTSGQAPGVYTFLVQAADADARFDQQALTVTVTASGGGSDLAGDTLATAAQTGLLPGVQTTIAGTVGDGAHGSRDVDLYKVSLLAGQKLTADVDAQVVAGGPPLSSLDSFLRLFDASGNQLAWNDGGTDPDTGTVSADAVLSFIAPADGTYYVGVSGAPNSGYTPTLAGSGVPGSTGAYQLKLTVTELNGTVTVLEAAENPVPAGQPVTFTAWVAGLDPLLVPTGEVTFYDGAVALGTAPLGENGDITFTVAELAAGSHSITAVYTGDELFRGSTSAPVVVVVT